MVLILVSLLAILLIVLLVRDIRPNRAPLIFGLRTIMILLLALVLLDVVVQRNLRVRAATDIVMLIDESQSMSTGKKPDRLAEALQHLWPLPGPRAVCFGFGDTVRRLADTHEIRTLGRRTDLSAALKAAREMKPGAVLILTDGEHNAVGDPARLAGQLEFPVYPIGIGQRQVRDIVVERLRGPDKTVAGDSVSMIVRISGTELEGERVSVRLFDNGVLTGTQQVRFEGKESRQELEFRFRVSSEGRHSYRVRADSVPGEVSYVNNQALLTVQVLPARTRVIYATNHPGFNTRLLLHWLRTSADIELIPLVALTGDRWLRITPQGMVAGLAGLPDADVLILDNIDGSNPELGRLISTFAASKGMLVLAGESFTPSPELASLLPLEPTGKRLTKELRLELTEVGSSHGVLIAGDRNLLTDLPPFQGAMVSPKVRPDAQVWAKAQDGTPLIAFRRNREGRILYFAGYPVWRGGFSAVTARERRNPVALLLGNIIRFLAMKETDRFRLTTDKLDYYEGEPVVAQFQATREDGRPWSGLDVRLKIVPEGSPSDSGYTTFMVERTSGFYEAALNNFGSGRYSVRAEIFAEGKSQGIKTHSFTVSELSLELTQTGLNEDLLREIARLTGGEYLPAESLGLRKPELRFAQYTRPIRFAPRTNHYLFLVIALLFVAEIFLRKRRGMA